MVNEILKGLVNSISWKSILLFVVAIILFIVVLVMLVNLIKWLFNLPYSRVADKFKETTGMDLAGSIENVFLGNRKYPNRYTVKYVKDDKDNGYYYELHLPSGQQRRRRVNEYPDSFIHVPGFYIKTNNPYTLWFLLEGFSKNKNKEVVLSDKSDKMFAGVNSYWRLANSLPDNLVSPNLKKYRLNKNINDREASAFVVVSQEERYFAEEFLNC